MPARAAKSDFLATISPIMKFSKDTVLKSDAKMSHKQDVFAPATFFFLNWVIKVSHATEALAGQHCVC